MESQRLKGQIHIEEAKPQMYPSSKALERFFLQGVAPGLAYIAGWNDGVITSFESFANFIANNVHRSNAPQAAYAFICAAREVFSEAILGLSLGVFDGALYVWVFVPDVDVDLTRKLFDLKDAIEQQENGQFEIHVKALQGRDLTSVLPHGFQLVAS